MGLKWEGNTLDNLLRLNKVDKVEKIPLPTGSPKVARPPSPAAETTRSVAVSAQGAQFMTAVGLHLKGLCPDNDIADKSRMFTLARNLAERKPDPVQQKYITTLQQSTDPKNQEKYKGIIELKDMISKQKGIDKKVVDTFQDKLQTNALTVGIKNLSTPQKKS